MMVEEKWTVLNESRANIAEFKSFEEAKEFALNAVKKDGKTFVIKDSAGQETKFGLLLG